MSTMYRTYNRPRQCCDYNTAQQELFNDTRNKCHSDNTEEMMHRHRQKREHMPIGMAYVPMQEWSEPYDACEGLYEGSAFPELNLIFCGVRGN